MFKNTSTSWEEIKYLLMIPSSEIWFVQNVIETFDGIALLTSANMEKEEGYFTVLSNTDQIEVLHSIILELQKTIPTLRISQEVHCGS